MYVKSRAYIWPQFIRKPQFIHTKYTTIGSTVITATIKSLWKYPATRSPNVASNLWSILYSHAVRFFLPLTHRYFFPISLSLSPFLFTHPPSRSPARSFALVPSHFPAFSLSSMTSFSRSHRLAYTQLFLSHHTSENPVSKRENGWTTCTRFKTNTTNLRVTLAGRYYVLFQLPPPPSLVHLPYVELSVPSATKTTNSPSCGTVIPHPNELFIS